MVTIPIEYEQTPRFVIERYDGKYTYIFQKVDDPVVSIAVIDDVIIEWTEHFRKMMEANVS